MPTIIPIPATENGEETENPKLLAFGKVNMAFDEENPIESTANSHRKGSATSGRSSVSFSPDEPHHESEKRPDSGGCSSINGNTTRSVSPDVSDAGACNTVIVERDFTPPPSPEFKPKVRPKAAVTVRNAVKWYGSNKDHPVLKNFGMTVPKGSIYSLLGASGCGKTTVLSCVVGLRHLKSGDISVFGAKPGTPESGVPGNRVGFMPQDIALYQGFTVDETLRYYGALYGMPLHEIKSSRDFLMSFLDLPDEARMISTMSLGQQRRVSLAVSFIHSPELLILDEPTVGVDPLLRESIWDHLVKLVAEQRTTVIITTHYIEEARQSQMVGLMRGGRLLAEKDPATLMKEHNALLLEDIVLKLCRKDKIGCEDDEFLRRSKNDDSTDVIDDYSDDEEELVEPYAPGRRFSEVYGKKRMSIFQLEGYKAPPMIFTSLQRIKALTMKNIFIMMRNFLLVLFMIFTPAMMVFVLCLGIGNDPKPMRMGIVNYEMNYSACLTLDSWLIEDGCDVENLSCKYLAKLPKDIIPLIEYDSEEAAREAVTRGLVWGYLAFPEGYSDNVYVRSASGNIINDEDLEGSFITYQLDMTNKQIVGSLKRILFDTYKDFVKELLKSCGLNEKLGESPLKALTPVYGSDDTDFREFIAPSILLGLLFFFPLCSSAVQYILDKKQGTLERAQVAGVQTSEIMAAFFLTEGIVLLIQSGVTLLIIAVGFGIVVRGSIFLAFLVTLSMGLAGVSMGFLIASFCTQEVEAIMLAMASFFPNFLLSGMLWPIEGMPIGMQYFSYILPCTLAGEAMRSIVSRGWGFFHPNVWPGFATTFAWIAFYWIVTICIHKIVLAKK